MKNGRMLYKHPGKHEFNDGWYDYIIVLEKDAEKYLRDGWYYTTVEAKQNSKIKKPEIVPKPKKMKAVRKKGIRLTEAQKKQIATDDGRNKDLALKWGIDSATVSRIRKKYAPKKVVVYELDKKAAGKSGV